MRKIINIPNYPKVFSYIDKGIPLYYFHLYQTDEIVNILQAINILSYGMKLYEKITDYETAISWIENGGVLESRVDTLRTKQQVIEYLENNIDIFKEI